MGQYIKYFVAGGWLLLAWQSYAQTDSLRLKWVCTVPKAATRIALDRMGQLYVYTPHEWIKYKADGSECCRYSSSQLTVSHILDITNPQKIIVFEPLLRRGVILDRTLSVTADLDCTTLDSDIALLCAAADDNIWLFDNFRQQPLKIDRNGQPLSILRYADPNIPPIANPTAMHEYENKVYVSDAAGKMRVYDVFGQLIKQLPLENLQNFNMVASKIIWLDTGNLHTFDLETGAAQQFTLPIAQKAIAICLIQGKLAVSDGKNVSVYQF